MYVMPIICLFILKSIPFHYTAQFCITTDWPCNMQEKAIHKLYLICEMP